MLKAGDLLRKQLIQSSTGNIIGHVEDLLLDIDHDRLVAFITTSPRWLREAHVVPWSTVRVIGDVILVQADVEPTPISEFPEWKALLGRKIRVSGTTVVSDDGQRIGTVGELLIDTSGAVKGYMITHGFLGSERHFVAAADIEALGSDALIIRRNSLRDSLDEQPLQRSTSTQVILPFTGTRVVVDESEQTPQASEHEPDLPQDEADAVSLGEHLVAENHAPPPPPPRTTRASTAEEVLPKNTDPTHTAKQPSQPPPEQAQEHSDADHDA